MSDGFPDPMAMDYQGIKPLGLISEGMSQYIEVLDKIDNLSNRMIDRGSNAADKVLKSVASKANKLIETSSVGVKPKQPPTGNPPSNPNGMPAIPPSGRGGTTPPPKSPPVSPPGGDFACSRIISVKSIEVTKLRFNSNITNSPGCYAKLTYVLSQDALRVTWQHSLGNPGIGGRIDEDRSLPTESGEHTVDVWIPGNPQFRTGRLLVVSLQTQGGFTKQCPEIIEVNHEPGQCDGNQPPQEPPQEPPTGEPKEQPLDCECYAPIYEQLKRIADCLCSNLKDIADEKPKVVLYDVYRLSDASGCYYVRQGEGSRAAGDNLIESGISLSAAKQAAEKCSTSPDSPSSEPSAPKDWRLPDFTCPIDGYSPTVMLRNDLLSVLGGVYDGIAGLNPLGGLVESLFDSIASVLPWDTGDKGKELAAHVNKIFADSLKNIYSNIAEAVPCTPAIATIGLVRFVLSIIEKWAGDVPPSIMARLTYIENSLCPYLYPTAAEADSAYISGTISFDTWVTWTQQNGRCPNPSERVMLAKQTKLSALDVVSLYRRDAISEQEARQRIRALGYLTDRAFDDIVKVTEWLPGPSDIIRFMMRDTENEQIVSQFNLNEGFENNFKGPIVEQAKAQGVSKEVMSQFWRAHWDIPSPTQLYEMNHRLRFDDIPEDIRTTIDDVKTALQQNDKLPFWIPRLLAIAYNPLGRIDIRKMYEMGVLKSEDVYRAYQELGYSDRDAKRLANYSEELKLASLDSAQKLKDYRMGVIYYEQAESDLVNQGYEPKDVKVYMRHARHAKIKAGMNDMSTKEYIEGSVSWNYVEDSLYMLGYDTGELRELKVLADRRIDEMRIDACKKAIKSRFMLAEISKEVAAVELRMLGINSEVAFSQSEAWACERAASRKYEPVSMLKGYYDLGILSVTNAVRRLMEFNYDETAAISIVTLWQLELKKRMEAAAEKEKEKLEKDLARKVRDEAKTKAQTARDKQRKQQQQQSEQEAIEKLTIQLEQEARKWAAALELETDSLAEIYLPIVESIKSAFSFSAILAIKVAIAAFTEARKEQTADVAGIAITIAGNVDAAGNILG